MNCGTSINTWAYSGVDGIDGHALVSADLISVDASTGDINVSKSKIVGTYKVKVIATLPDLATSTYEIFEIKIMPNNPPSFKTALDNIKKPFDSVYSFKFPELTDLDSNDAGSLKIEAVTLQNNTPLPSFIAITGSDFSSLAIYPDSSQIGIYPVRV